MSRTGAHNALVALSCLLVSLKVVAQPVPNALPEAVPVVVLLAVTLNGQDGGLGTAFTVDAQGHLLADGEFLNAWNLRPVQASASAPDGEVLFDLKTIQGLSYVWDRDDATLAISALPDAFVPTRLNLSTTLGGPVADYTPGGYLKYDASVTQIAGSVTKEAVFDLGWFRGKGLLTHRLKAGTGGVVRLMTTWQTDRVDDIKTLRLGDSYNSTGAWGLGVLFGGIQYGTNFAIRPEFVAAAMPSVSGKALLPSTLDVYLNNSLRSRQQVGAGPFSVQNLPVITGDGTVQIIVKDVLGREQLITQSFFSSPVLLRQGLVDSSSEFGWVRQNYGLSSDSYADPFLAFNWRRGMTPDWTGEFRLEGQRDIFTGGVSSAVGLPRLKSVLESTLAVSSARGLAQGVMGIASYSYLGRNWSANARLQSGTSSFRQIGTDSANILQHVATLQFTTPLASGSLSANYVQRLNHAAAMTRIANVNYSQRLTKQLFASVTLFKLFISASGGGSGATLGLSLTALLDAKHFGSSTLTRSAAGNALYTDFQQSTPLDEGLGYRLATLMDANSSRQEASVTRNQSFGGVQVDVVRLNQVVSTRLSASGGVALLGGDLYLTRGLDQGLAIVQTGDMAGVPVLLENQIVAHTDSHGRAIVNNLQPYQVNHISVDPLSLPMDMAISEVEKSVVPRSQGGVLVDFGIRRLRSVTLQIVQADGTPLPPWTPVRVHGMDKTYVVGLRGEVSLELPADRGNRLTANPVGAPVCQLLVDLPPAPAASQAMEPQACAP